MTMPIRALLLILLGSTACAPLKEHRQLSVIETRSPSVLEESDVAAAPSEDGRAPRESRPPRPRQLDAKSCLVLGRAVEILDDLRVADDGDGWKLHGMADGSDLRWEAYYLRVELFRNDGSPLLSIISPLDASSGAGAESCTIDLDLPRPDLYRSMRVGIVTESRAHDRLSLWD